MNLFGHANPRINAAVAAQLGKLEHVILAGFTHEPAVQLAERLTRLAPPGLTRCFFADNGSSAIEVALKMSFHYWRNHGQPRKRRFITLANSYHGETLGALAVGDVELYREIYEPLLMDVIDRALARRVRARTGRDRGGLRAPCHRRRWTTLLEQHADEICAVIVEPLVQCAGGMRMYYAAVPALLREACDRHGVHLIADEIAVGFGRTGTLFACEQAGITPDFLCLSKGLTGGYLPLSAVLTSERCTRRSTTSTRSCARSCTPTATPAIRSPAPRRSPRSTSSPADDVIERNRALAAHLGRRACELLGELAARGRGAPVRHDRRGRTRARRRPPRSPSTGASAAACASTATGSSTRRCCGPSATWSISCRRT